MYIYIYIIYIYIYINTYITKTHKNRLYNHDQYIYGIIFYACLFYQEGLLGVFQKLIASKTNDNHGFDLLSTIIDKVPQ